MWPRRGCGPSHFLHLPSPQPLLGTLGSTKRGGAPVVWPCTVPSAPVLSNAPCAFSNRIPWPRQRPSLSLTAWGIGPTARQGTWPSPVTRKLGAFPLRFLRTQSSPSPGPATPHPHPQLNACSFSFTGVLLVGGGGRGGGRSPGPGLVGRAEDDSLSHPSGCRDRHGHFKLPLVF